ncbi:MAG: lipoyl(octanoyl) transferase LipB [Gammaproteobacteria bacterium]|nr:lipoyl(octanoyl) transferase LipB [Gammaproteobacteria bacterium]
MSSAALAASAADVTHQVIVRDLGRTEYGPVFQDMQEFTRNRGDDTPDELWFTEHDPVFTQGQAGKTRHLLAAGDIPVVQTDRGGQVTYHGPGQIVGYLLFDLRRMGLSVRGLVSGIESAIIDVLGGYGIVAEARPDAPGVYVNGAKIAALGLRVRRHCSYHGLAFNIDMDLEPFQRINPCGISGLEVTQLKDLCGEADTEAVKSRLLTAMTGPYPVNFRRPDRRPASRA